MNKESYTVRIVEELRKNGLDVTIVVLCHMLALLPIATQIGQLRSSTDLQSLLNHEPIILRVETRNLDDLLYLFL